jgi:hypothetical protein
MEAKKDVELDTDDVQEQAIAVEEAPKEDVKPEIGDVDLGYSDPIKEKTEAKIVKETTQPETNNNEDNLEDYSEGVKKRIDKLTRRMREAERGQKAALDYAKGLQSKYTEANKQAHKYDKDFVKEFEARVDSERNTVKQNLKQAIEENDSTKIMECNDKLTQLAVEKEKAKIKTRQHEEQEAKEKEVIQTPPTAQPAPLQNSTEEASPRAQEWATDNKWFGNDQVLTNAAFGVHNQLVSEGFDAESEQYYNEVNQRMTDLFGQKYPQYFASEQRPVQTVASAGRKQQGRKTVKLTRSQVAIAKKLGVPLEEYAKHVKELN